MLNNGIYKDINFISTNDIIKLEDDILRLTNCKNNIEFSDLCVKLDKLNKDDLFNLNKFINRHHIVTSLQNNLISSLEKNDLVHKDYFPLYLGGGFFIWLT